MVNYHENFAMKFYHEKSRSGRRPDLTAAGRRPGQKARSEVSDMGGFWTPFHGKFTMKNLP